MNDQWPEVIPLDRHQLPDFPTTALPAPLRDYAQEVAEAYQVPEDLPGTLMLSTLAAGVGKRVVVQVRPDWSEPCNLYTVVALPPAHRKSAVFKAVNAPLERYEKHLSDDQASAVAAASQERAIMERRVAELEKRAVKASPEECEPLMKEAAELRAQLPDVPRPERLLVDDVSPERLAQVLGENGGRIALMSAEGGVFDIIAGRYNNGTPNLDVYLKGHAGDTLRVDRIGRPADFVESPALTVGLAIQPEVLRGLIDKPGFRGRGLLGRFLYSLPPSRLGYRKARPQSVIPPTRAAYESLITQVANLGTKDSAGSSHSTRLLTLSPGAECALTRYQTLTEAELAPGGTLSNLLDWAGKLPGAVVRIAGLLHVAEHPRAPWNTPISEQTVEAAIRLGNYFRDHALAVFDLMGADETADNARHILDWIERNQAECFTGRDIFQALKGRFKRMKPLRGALDLLEDHGYLVMAAEESVRAAGRPPSPTYLVNPTAVSHNSQNDRIPASALC